MKKKLTHSLIFLAVYFSINIMGVGIVSAQVDPNLNTRLQQAPIIVNHTSLSLFEQIPDLYIQRAAAIPMIFGNRSVGVNTDEAISCLAWESDEACWDNRPNCLLDCIKLDHADPTYNLPADTINWYRPGGYNRTNWIHEPFAETWYTMTADYMALLDNNQVQGQRSINNFSVYTFQFSYLNVLDFDSIAEQPGGFFWNNAGDKNDVYDLETRLARFPNKYFIFMTSSLARSIGNSVATDFNNQMRQYIQQRDSLGKYRVFLDFADIESHLPDGSPCYDDRDGVQYCQSPGVCENLANDGINYPAICQHYTVETTNGHLTMGPIRIRIAKAFWVLMAQLAGWNPGGVNPSPVPSQTSTPTPSINPGASVTDIPTQMPTSSPTQPPLPGDANGDRRVDGIDYVIWLNHYNQETNGGYLDGDFNSDGMVDGIDYVIWLNNYV